MAQAKKFGTFGGVFTPSILTILGVIMYLRLGWVVGEAGFYSALLLILVAHIISISTGLSLSSIATDKKIKTGGIYYMLSRSLGLPMGGSIGITLFLGTALSISLYIVGFVENFLSIEAINHFLGMSGTINDIRIVGTLVIVFLVVLAYISTSIAIKTQFFILGSIALSLVSIIVGVFLNVDSSGMEPALTVAADSPDLIVIFAVFFPAVTGFTAGVAMSGDLKSPKDSIPKGTLMAIGVGLVVYICLAYLFAFYVDRDLLISDTNFLQKIAWSSPLVIAGIWGATLSSALGGILGGPRILQAMSADKVTHHFFAKGVGESNEPRRALILTFVLAEMGILIGQLDVIAGIVSMFYIAAYGFINLAYVLERWANSDFRPSMKISIWIGIVGFIASIGVMLKLDTLGMVVAFGIMFGIYIFLKRREVQGNMTDVWQSVWTSIIRSSLTRINKKPLKEANWQPNIILFSGGGNARPHLLELGKDIAGKQGFLSNFDLQLAKDSAFLFPKPKQKVQTDEDDENVGIFTRRQSVQNVYDGIEMIAQTYGFSGVEPNTIMMGWARQTEDPLRFSKLVYNLSALDMNVIMLDYDKEHQWGKKETIDIWWRGGGNNGNLALTLSKFITQSEDWNQATIRLLIVNQQNGQSASIYENAQHILDSLRIDAELHIINNEIEQRSFYDIIKVESVDSDLIFLGFPPIVKGEEQKFVEETNKLCHSIGTVAIIRASSQFKDLSLGEWAEENKVVDDILAISHKKTESIKNSIDTVNKPQLEPYLFSLSNDIDQLSTRMVSQLLSPLFEQQVQSLEQLHQAGVKSFDNLISRAPNNNASTFRKSVSLQHQIFIRGQLQYAEKNRSENLESIFSEKLMHLTADIDGFVGRLKKFPYRVKSILTKDDFHQAMIQGKNFKKQGRYLQPLFLFSSEIPYYIHLRELVLAHYPQTVYQQLNMLVALINKYVYQLENEVYKSQQRISAIFESTFDLCSHTVPSTEELQEQRKKISEIVQKLILQQNSGFSEIVHKVRQFAVVDLNHMIAELNHPMSNAYIDYQQDYVAIAKKKKFAFNQSFETWKSNKELSDHVSQLNLVLLSFRFSAQSELLDLQQKLHSILEENISKLSSTLLEIIKLAKAKEGEAQKVFVADRMKSFVNEHEIRFQQLFIDQYNHSLKKIKLSIGHFPEQLTIFTDSSIFTGGETNLNPLHKIDVAVRRTIDFMVERELMDIRERMINMGLEANMLKSQLSEVMQSMTSLLSIDPNPENTELMVSKDSALEYAEVLDLAMDKVIGLNAKLKDKQEILQSVMLKKVEGFKASLDLYPFIRSIQDLKQYIKTAQTKRWFNKAYLLQKQAHEFVSQQLNKIWYNQSSGLLLAQKLSKMSLHQETRVENLLAFKAQVSPSPQMMNRLPDYYHQLYLRKQYYLNEFWVKREEETQAFHSGFQQWLGGHGGAILVLGERNSGKSFFVNYIAQHIDVKGETYFINPPYTGSTSTREFLKSFQNATDITAGFDTVFNDIPSQSIFILDDLELWWEKGANGMMVIDELSKIIDLYGHQHLFVVVSNIHTFSLINKYRKIESDFIRLIELRPFNARQIKDVIMKRHATSALNFVLNSTHQNRFRSWNFARLFSRYFNYSEGNPGVALQAWISSVEDVDKNTISIKMPKIPDITLFRYMETEWMIFIMHFILHKRMNMPKLIRVSMENRVEVEERVRVLKRAGIIVEIGEDILDINQFVLPFLRKALVKRELL
jgi:amino acid transporter